MTPISALSAALCNFLRAWFTAFVGYSTHIRHLNDALFQFIFSHLHTFGNIS